MPYFDCFLTPVPRAHRAQYEALARLSAEILREHGALAVTECWLDEDGPAAESYHGETARRPGARYRAFAEAAGAQVDETVVLSFIEWPDKPSRDAGMAKVTADPRMQFDDRAPVFDGARLIAGGFVPMSPWPRRQTAPSVDT
jgi:uncharacterized protein YbaA (DUF1428 family)